MSEIMLKHKTIAVLDLGNKKLIYKINAVGAVFVLPVILIFSALLEMQEYSSIKTSMIMLGLLILLIPGIFLHEGSHYFAQWIFSHKKPRMGFKFPSPYSALSPDSSISRNEAIITALAPLVLVTMMIVVPAIFTQLFVKTILLAWAFVEIPTCCGDIYTIGWLIKHPRASRLKNVDLRNELFIYIP